MPNSKGRRRKQGSRAKETQAAQREAKQRKQLTPAQYRSRRVAGWSMVAVAIFVGVFHWSTHIGLSDIASQGAQDLLFGYPLAAVLGIGGAMVLSKA